MRKSKFTSPQQQAILVQHDGGASVTELCHEHQISAPTFYKWKKTHEDGRVAETQQLTRLEQENQRLRRMYAELSMDHEILREGYSMLKKWRAQDAKRS